MVVLLHGGFWREHRTLDLMRPLAAALARDGVAVWNLEYRRVGHLGGGWPGTFHDVAAGIAALAALPERAWLVLDRVTLVGHSAGGQLALWAGGSCADGAAGPHQGSAASARHVRPAAVVSLAGVCDLVAAAIDGIGRDAVRQFLAGGPDACPERYRAASPHLLLPLGVPQVLVHGDDDGKVPITQSRTHAVRARRAGDPVALIEVPGADHMAVLEPAHVAAALAVATRLASA